MGCCSTGANGGHDASDRAREHSVHAHRLGRRRGQEIRERRDDGNRPERREQHRRDADLRRATTPPADRAPTRARAVARGSAADSTAMPALAPHDSRKPTECSRNGSITSSTITASAERAAGSMRAGRRTSEPSATTASAGRAQHRRLESGHGREQQHDRDGGNRARPERQPPEQRAEERERERDVPTRHREQVREPGTAVRRRRRRRERRGCRRAGSPASSARVVGGSGAVPRSTTARNRLASVAPCRAADANASTSRAIRGGRPRAASARDRRSASGAAHPAGLRARRGRRPRARAGAARRRRSRRRAAVRCPPLVGTRTNASVAKRPLSGSSASTPASVTGSSRAIAPVSEECASPSSARWVCAPPISASASIDHREPRPARRRTTPRPARSTPTIERGGRRTRPGVLTGEDPGDQPAEREQHAELVHLTPSRSRGAARAGPRRCRARG